MKPLLATLCATTMVAAISAASAQSSMQNGTSGATATPEGQCWDTVSRTVKNQSGSPSGAKTPGGITTGSTPSGQGNNNTGTGNVPARPAAAANLPTCS
jgi:hypothetical protein